MRKYYQAYVDLSEIVNITATTDEQLQRAQERLAELGLLTEKGNPSPSQIGALASSVTPPLIEKAARRLARRGGVEAVHGTFTKFYEKKEYNAMYLYLVIVYGLLEWQVPEGLTLLPAVPAALKVYMDVLMTVFAKGAQGKSSDGADNAQPEKADAAEG